MASTPAIPEEPMHDAGTTEEAPTGGGQEAEPAAAPPVEEQTIGKKRPRLDLTTESRERKRGKSMFGILVGTLNKAKKEDHDRSASEAARKRASIDRRLQNQLAEENDNVRRAEELKRDRQMANRKEEELKLREMIYQHRRSRLPALAHFLLTSDKIPTEDPDESSPSNPTSAHPLAAPPRTHPPPLFYLPAVLTSAQAAFIEKRKEEVNQAAEKEWEEWNTQRKDGYEEVEKLRAHVEEEEEKRRVAEKEKNKEDVKPQDETLKDEAEKVEPGPEDVKMDESVDVTLSSGDGDADKGPSEKEKDKEITREGDVAMEADGDDAVEY